MPECVGGLDESIKLLQSEQEGMDREGPALL